VIDTGFKMTS